ncbi:hypothetical protein [Actinacidiphila guanduensis]|jgi:hypothetical protein|uniref:Uncharacterized protein n=1 Tax=Actinacidiphila guanduensis TaxID=310781 RepID=A0A1G9ZHU9_9ACTN|nr:hypothetical protein [Actinacidiphila guanduensis]SDN20765.1 hypothetical protein SAMN05216259_103164 [Actinacidiphila guanduensis]
MSGLTVRPTQATAPPVGELRPDLEWFRWAGRHPVGALLVTAFVATQVATTLGYFMPAIGLPQLAWPLHNGFVAAPGTPEGTAASYFAGQFMHYLNGIAFVLIFGLLVHPRLPFRDTDLGNLLKATVYVVVLTLISTGLLVPKIYAPHAGYGLFSFGHGWKFPFAVLLWHLLFGVHIAALHNPGRVARLRLEDQRRSADATTPTTGQ